MDKENSNTTTRVISSSVTCSLFIFSVANRNYYPLATVANKNKGLPLTQKVAKFFHITILYFAFFVVTEEEITLVLYYYFLGIMNLMCI
jgi:hypothetical protein